jgi:hypothetical protein
LQTAVLALWVQLVGDVTSCLQIPELAWWVNMVQCCFADCRIKVVGFVVVVFVLLQTAEACFVVGNFVVVVNFCCFANCRFSFVDFAVVLLFLKLLQKLYKYDLLV